MGIFIDILRRYLHSKTLYLHTITLMSETVMPLVALIFADNTNLHILNSSSEKINDIVGKAQQLLEA